MASYDMEYRKLYLDQILENCSLEDVNTRKILINKLFENPKFLDENGILYDDAIYLIRDIYKENLDVALKMLDEYKNSDSKLSRKDFFCILNYFKYEKFDASNISNAL